MLEVQIGKHALKFFKRLPAKQVGQITRKIGALALYPFPPDSKQLKGNSYRGTDIGEYRIIYRVEGSRLNVPLVGKRNDDEVYRKLKRME